MKPHTFHPEAGQEYTQAVERYASIDSELGNRFYDEIERLIGNVCADPERFFQIRAPVRRALSRDFPYSVVYIDQPDRMWIVAVMHAKRRPDYWRDRLG
ncbi:MAG: type II toxin-antitoxin system RelE/ParE family toxin [Verrucomicrobia bacterium]|nr:type II toxin-antitoxin system RelE/ParE family toxin [Verrucomicrobiota bacterium]